MKRKISSYVHLGERVYFTVWVLFCGRKTTTKVLIPERVLKESELKFHYQIVNYMEKYQIPPLLIISFDQTPLNYIQISSNTIEKDETKKPIHSLK